MKKQNILLSFSLLLCSMQVWAKDNWHFYRAGNFFGEARLEKPWLGSLDLSLGGGSTSSGWNSTEDITCLFDIYGFHNMLLLGKGVPGLDLSNPLDQILDALSKIPAEGTLGLFSIGGKFRLLETYLTLTQNVTKGFFFQADIPFRKFHVCNLSFNSLDPEAENLTQLQPFLQSFDAILERYNLDKKGFKKAGIGDIALLVGWTINFEDTDILDFIDVTFKSGVLIPSGRPKNENVIFDIPHGYNNHLGIPFSTDVSLGLYEWLTLGVHGDALIFKDKTQTIRMKTDTNQSGMIKLAKGCANIQQGTLWSIGAFIKWDHVAHLVSWLFGYSFANKNSDVITPTQPELFSSSVVNSDQLFQGWKMQTFHIWLEFDLTKENHRFGPRIGAFFNIPISGKRTFKTKVGGLLGGLDIAWALD